MARPPGRSAIPGALLEDACVTGLVEMYELETDGDVVFASQDSEIQGKLA